MTKRNMNKILAAGFSFSEVYIYLLHQIKMSAVKMFAHKNTEISDS